MDHSFPRAGLNEARDEACRAVSWAKVLETLDSLDWPDQRNVLLVRTAAQEVLVRSACKLSADTVTVVVGNFLEKTIKWLVKQNCGTVHVAGVAAHCDALEPSQVCFRMAAHLRRFTPSAVALHIYLLSDQGAKLAELHQVSP